MALTALTRQLIPEDMAFNSIDEPCYVSADEMVRIEKDCEVRLRIVGTRNDANEIVCALYIFPLDHAPALTHLLSARSSASGPLRTTT